MTDNNETVVAEEKPQRQSVHPHAVSWLVGRPFLRRLFDGGESLPGDLLIKNINRMFNLSFRDEEEDDFSLIPTK